MGVVELSLGLVGVLLVREVELAMELSLILEITAGAGVGGVGVGVEGGLDLTETAAGGAAMTKTSSQIKKDLGTAGTGGIALVVALELVEALIDFPKDDLVAVGVRGVLGVVGIEA